MLNGRIEFWFFSKNITSLDGQSVYIDDPWLSMRYIHYDETNFINSHTQWVVGRPETVSGKSNELVERVKAQEANSNGPGNCSCDSIRAGQSNDTVKLRGKEGRVMITIKIKVRSRTLGFNFTVLFVSIYFSLSLSLSLSVYMSVRREGKGIRGFTQYHRQV